MHWFHCVLLVFLNALPTLAEESKSDAELNNFIQHHQAKDENFILKFAAILGEDESTGIYVTPEWKVSRQSHSSFSTKGSSGDVIPEGDRGRINELISKLPEGEKSLPPRDRRFLLQAKSGESVKTRVYDRAQLPEVVLELLRLSSTVSISSWSPRFLSTGVIQSYTKTSHNGAFGLFPDGKRILSAAEYGPIKIWDTSSRKLLQEFEIELKPRYNIEGMVLSPDGSLAAVQIRYRLPRV
jgi:WD40 repeat protein